MPRKRQKGSAPDSPSPATDHRSPHDFRVLVVEPESQVRRLLAETIQDEHVTVLQACSLAEARQQMRALPVDVALIDPALPDGSGMQLARELGRRRSRTQTIVITGQPSLEQAIEAIRAGVADFVVKPLDLADLNKRVRAAMDRKAMDRQRQERHLRLRRLCRKLDHARQQVTQQVDVLCNDLVTAYQELAGQMNQAVQGGEYAAMIRDELDLEGLLRKTLEYLINKAGPTNAAIFLPATEDEYSLGGYVNYDCTSDAADLLLQHLADVVAPRMTEQLEPVHITDNQRLQEWIGDDQAYLADSHVLAITARQKDEALAVIVLFRDGSLPFDRETVETVAAIAPLCGNALARIIRVHHRHVHDFEPDDGLAY